MPMGSPAPPAPGSGFRDDERAMPLDESGVVGCEPAHLRFGLMENCEEAGASASAGEVEDAPPRRWCHIPVIFLVVVTMIILSTASSSAPLSTPTNGDMPPPPIPSDAHDDPEVPTLLSLRNHPDGGLLNARRHFLCKQLKRAIFHESINDLVGQLSSGKNQVGFGDVLTLTWNQGVGSSGRVDAVSEEDVIALYCPFGEDDPKKFRDAATVAQARATHAHHGGSDAGMKNIWSIPSFPTVREDSCEFRLYACFRTDEESCKGEGSRRRSDPENNPHHYSLAASTGPIVLTSKKTPTGIHISLTGKASEMNIQFTTGEKGEALVEIARKSDLHSFSEGRRHLAQGTAAARVSWTKLEGVSTSYLAADMCQAPATSTEQGFFVPPGHLHTVKATGLEPSTEYVYRVGLGFGQGVTWSEKYYVFRSSPPPGSLSSVPGKSALAFLAFSDQGCKDSKNNNVDPAQDVAGLVTSLIGEQRIDSIHQFGGLSYADGSAHAWDVWMDMIQPYATRVPLMIGVGNHEYDHTEGGGAGKDPSGISTASGFQPSWGEGSFDSTGGECGVPVARRFAVPPNGNGVFWYSYDQSLVHTVMLSSEHNNTVGSPQYAWLEKDLGGVNRSITPWVVVEISRPLYNIEFVNWLQMMVGLGMRNEIEDLLRKYQVDLVLSGHYHSYFRSCDGLYLNKCENGGPTFITVGTGGAPLSDNSTSLMPNEYTEYYDKEHWGVGRANVFNRTALLWQFIAVGGNVTDEMWLHRESRR